MKKLLALLFVLVLVLSLAACDFFTPTPEHECEFVVTEQVDPTCTKDGSVSYKCEGCSETKTEVLPALDHEYKLYTKEMVCCDQYGSEVHKCTRCGKKKNVTVYPTEHVWGEFTEYSRAIQCTNEGCTRVKYVDGTGKYELVFTFGDEDKAALEAKYDEIKALLDAAAAYDPALHGFVESGDLYDSYMVGEELYIEYTDMIYAAMGQQSIAMTLYYCDHENAELEKIYNDMQVYYTDLVSKYYSLSEPWYDSMYRDYFFYGATEEEIREFLADSRALSNPEYVQLKARNDEIELQYNAIASPEADERVPILYAEFVQNSNRMAELLGYDSYLDYAYGSVYGRDYTADDSAAFVEYVKTYITPVYNLIYNKWYYESYTYPDAAKDAMKLVSESSFFDNSASNQIFNDYIDDMAMAFTSNPDKQISFSDELNSLMADGNLFRGTYAGAYVSYIYSMQLPIAYFGKGYDSTFTIAHEFGHYINDVYNSSEYDQSYDLLETHSQGHEFLYLYYLGTQMDETSFEYVEMYQILNTLYAIMMSTQVDCFEQAIYRNSYDGYNSEVIMADGQITYDEYDDLYAAIGVDLGIAEMFRNDSYWRYGMTISSPCYYISYAVSAINALQIYTVANDEGFEAARDAYLSTISYTDTLESTEDYMTLEEVLVYAGLNSYNDESTYVGIANYIIANYRK